MPNNEDTPIYSSNATFMTARRVRPKSVQLKKEGPEQQEQKLQQEEKLQQEQRGQREALSLGITLNYVKDWNTSAAFRELYQNWKDAILRTFQLHSLSFQPHYHEDESSLSITASGAMAQDCGNSALGFITYEKKSGRLLLINHCAQLDPAFLYLGHTSSDVASHLAGCHGEGLKLAAVVMARSGYEISISSEVYKWTFSCSSASDAPLLCSLTTRGTEEVVHLPPEMRHLQISTRNSVCVSIGPETNQRSRSIELKDLERWLQVTIDIRGLNYPTSIIETEYGHIILDPKYESRIYVKGVLVPSSYTDTKHYKLGYNFLHGTVGRDRRRLMKHEEEADLVRRMWESAIQRGEALAVPVYVNLLRNFSNFRDVELADQLLQQPAKDAIWSYLKQQSNVTGFYYCENHGPESANIIRNCLKREPLLVSAKLWTILEANSAVRTPKEEALSVFQNAPPYKAPDTSFSKHVQRGLAACFALSDLTKRVTFCFVRSEKSHMDVFFDHKTEILKVHHRWLDFEASHEGSPCRAFVPSNMVLSVPAFSCDHVIEELAEDALRQMNAPDLLSRSRDLRDRIRLMPRDISLELAHDPGSLIVRWRDNEMESFSERFGSVMTYHIVLHDDGKCVEQASELLHNGIANPQVPAAPCNCPQGFSLQNCKIVTFRNLDCSKKYFPMVALNQDKAFYGVPAEAISPSAPELSPWPKADTTLNPQISRHTRRKCFLW